MTEMIGLKGYMYVLLENDIPIIENHSEPLDFFFPSKQYQ